MEQNNLQTIEIPKKKYETIIQFCELNDIEDPKSFIFACLMKGYNIEKYGLLGDGDQMFIEVEKEVPVEVVKEVYVADLEALKKLENTIQTLNNELSLKSDKIKNLEEQVKELSRNYLQKGAILRGSNLNDLYSK
jgi:predicted RNase H-like nuclease (RuvC/YqgF family)